jgi:conjugal transfer/type IV secretion protein DotA/TraY
MLGTIGARARDAGVTPGSAARYLFAPQLGPRFAHLFARGFAYIPYYIALLYQAVGLLPAGHPYTLGANIGRFGVRHAVAEAANRLVLDWRRADQIILFLASLAGIALAAAQIVLLPLTFAIAASPAAAWGFADLVTPNPEQDLAFILLDMVFGVPDIFNSCISTGVPCEDQTGRFVLTGFGGFPHPIHHALHALLSTYSWGLVVIAIFILCYFVTAVAVETAQTGTPMGKRFNQSWGVLRMLLAIGLLIPTGFGLNTAQYIVLHAAKFGSGLATNGWVLFLDEITGSALGQRQSLIGTPNIPELDDLLQFYHTAATCTEAYTVAGQEVKPYLVRNTLVSPHNKEMAKTSYKQMVDFAQGGDRVFVRFGTPDKKKNVFWKGYVRPTCGEIAFTLTDARVPGSSNPPDEGPRAMQEVYWAMLQDLWAAQSEAPNYPYRGAQKYMRSHPEHNTEVQTLTQARKAELLRRYQQSAREGLAQSVAAQMAAHNTQDFQIFKNKGWAFAGTLYDYIAKMGGPVATATFNLPVPSHYPALMEKICTERQALDARGPSTLECFNPDASEENGFQKASLANPLEEEQALAMYYAARNWGDRGAASRRYASDGVAEFFFMLFGADGLFDMRENQNVHPLAQLTMVGRSLVEAALRNIGWALGGGGAVGGILNAFGLSGLSGGIGAIAGFLLTIATVALTVGFLLYYIMPFLPFIYFFFGVGGWIKAIFEAMVGTPLWALAHLRIDGEGLTGDAAKNGYFLILEIFLRPILLVFGLLAGMSIFAAMVMGLNAGWDLVVANLSGFSGTDQLGDPGFTDVRFYRSYVDQFFFTLVYAITVYMVGMASFKLIDMIPNEILRWIGVSIKPFSDAEEQAAEKMMQSAQMGGQQAIGQVIGGQGLQGVVGKLSGGGKP